MVTLIEDITDAIEEASETGQDVNELINGRFYIGRGGMNIKLSEINLKTKQINYDIYWPDGDIEFKETESLNSDYWEKICF